MNLSSVKSIGPFQKERIENFDLEFFDFFGDHGFKHRG